MRKAIDASVLQQSSRGFRLFFWSLLTLYGLLALYALHHVASTAPISAVKRLRSGARIQWTELESNKLQMFILEDGAVQEPLVVERNGEKSAKVALARCRRCWRGAPGAIRNGALLCSVCGAKMSLPEDEGKAASCSAVPVRFSTSDAGLRVEYGDVDAVLRGLQ